MLDGDWHFWTVFLLGRGLSLNLTLLDRACRARQSGFGVKKKTRLLKGLGSGNRYGPMGRVQA